MIEGDREDVPSPKASKPTSQPTSSPHFVPARTPAITIGIVDEHSFTRECMVRSLRGFDCSLEIKAFAACEEFTQGNRDLDVILYHSHENMSDKIEQQTNAIKGLTDIVPVIILSPIDMPEAIFAAIENGARGYIPTASTSMELTIEIIRLVKAGGTFLPPSSVTSSRNGTRPTVTPRAAAAGRFTPRQMEVLEHLKLGRANKTIAHELEMSESTVKVHIRNIMKKMNATNRTEAACRAHDLVNSDGSAIS